MASTTILSDNGASSGSAGLKSTAGNDGVLILQTTTSGGTATNAVYVDNSQNMGLGVTPSAWDANWRALQIGNGGALEGRSNLYDFVALEANTYYSGAQYKYITTANASRYYQYQGQHIWQTAPSGTAGNPITFTQAMTLDASGNLGVGTPSPSTYGKFAVSLGNSAYFTTTQASIYGTNDIFIQGVAAAGQYTVFEGYNGSGTVIGTGGSALPLLFSINRSERARIDSSGNLYINGTTLPYSAVGAKVVINNPLNAGIFNITSIVNSTASQGHFNFVNNNGNVGSIQTSGSTTSYSTSSDYRLKNSIAPMTGALARVAALKPVTYKWNADNSDGEGFIAHELAEICPQAVHGEKDAVETYIDEEGNEQTRPVYQGIDTSFLVATLTAAIQEQQAIIEQLRADVAALKGQA